MIHSVRQTFATQTNTSTFTSLSSCEPPMYRPLSPPRPSLLPPAPCLGVVIESSCDKVTIVHTEQLLEEGPDLVQSSKLPQMQTSQCLQGTSSRRLKVCTLVQHKNTRPQSFCAAQSVVMEAESSVVVTIRPEEQNKCHTLQ